MSAPTAASIMRGEGTGTGAGIPADHGRTWEVLDRFGERVIATDCAMKARRFAAAMREREGVAVVQLAPETLRRAGIRID